MKKMIVCGDSFMSPVVSFPGTHFSQIFASELNLDIEIYARSGMSNAGIMIQLNSAIAEKPDLIMFSVTSFDRTELPVKTLEKNNLKSYTRQDLLYTQSMGLSSLYPYINKSPKLWSISISDLLDHVPYDSTRSYFENHNTMTNLQFIEDYEEKMNTAREWFKYLYDPVVKRMIDSFMMYGIIHKLHLSGIPYLWVHDGMWLQSWIDTDWLEVKSDLRKKIGHMINKDRNVIIDNDPGYHTTVQTQKEIAIELIQHYRNYFL